MLIKEFIELVKDYPEHELMAHNYDKDGEAIMPVLEKHLVVWDTPKCIWID